MKKIIKRSLGLIIAMVMTCMCMVTSAFAAENEPAPEAKCYNLEVTSDGIESISDENGNDVDPNLLRSSISGYNQATISGNPVGVLVYVSASGTGGMGITVKTSSSWSGYMNLDMIGSNGSIPLSGRAVYSNGETQVNNLQHNSPSYYVFSFRGIPSGQSVFVQIWVYG